MSSSSAKPCTHHTVAVLASALAIKGRAIAPAAASPADARKTDRLVSLSISSLPCSKRRAACSVDPWFGRVCAVGRGGSIVYHRPGAPGRLKCYLGHSRATFEALIGHPLLSYRAFAEGGSRELVSGTGPYPSRVSLTDNPTHPDLPEGVSADRLLP